jgi:hypothetical protein
LRLVVVVLDFSLRGFPFATSDSFPPQDRDEQLASLTRHHRPTYANSYAEVGANLTATTRLALLNVSSLLSTKQRSGL